MKKSISTIIICMIFANIMAQNVPNSGFENWVNSPSFEIPAVSPPTDMFFCSNYQTLGRYPNNIINLTKVSNGAGKAMRIETQISGADTVMGYGIWGVPPEGGTDFKGGFPFSDQSAIALTADLRYSIDAASPGLVIMQFRKNGAAIGGNFGSWYIFPISGNKPTFDKDTFFIYPALPMAPDSLCIAFTSNTPDGVAIDGSFMEIDNLSFLGSSQQVPGGNMDNWVMAPTGKLPSPWKSLAIDPFNSFQSTESYSGNFAAKMEVVEGGGTNNYIRFLILGDVRIDSSQSIFYPGMSISERPSSLGYYYKYTSPGVDTANVYALLYKWDSGNNNRILVGYCEKNLLLSSSYTYDYASVTYLTSDVPDSVYLQLSPSVNWDTGSVIGSRLLVDDIKFVSCNENISISGNTEVCPNSTGQVYTIDGNGGSGFVWNVPAGATIVSGANTNSITVDFGATGGTVSVEKLYHDANCSVRVFDLTVNTTSAITIDAGASASVCANQFPIQLNGSMSGAGGISWSSTGGGTFSDNTSLTSTFTPSASQIGAGTVTLTITSTGNGTCSAATDNVTFSFIASPQANAGNDRNLCSNNSVITLNGTVSNASGGTWQSAGTGSFNNNSALNAIYTPSANDIASGCIKLILTSTGNGTCAADADTVEVCFTPSPIVDAGADITQCANNLSVSVQGTVSIATGGAWTTTGNGSFTGSGLSRGYTPSAADITAGCINLILTSTGNGNCLAVTDTLSLCITAAPTISVSGPGGICNYETQVNSLQADTTSAMSILWSSSGCGTFDNSSSSTPVYTICVNDSINGSVTLYCTAEASGCLSVTDSTEIVISACGGLKDQLTSSAVEIRPNPFQNVIDITNQENVREVIMYDISGKELLKTVPTSLSKEVKISIPDLPKGLYILKVNNYYHKVIRD